MFSAPFGEPLPQMEMPYGVPAPRMQESAERGGEAPISSGTLIGRMQQAYPVSTTSPAFADGRISTFRQNL